MSVSRRARAVVAFAVLWGTLLAVLSLVTMLATLASHAMPAGLVTPIVLAGGVLRAFATGALAGAAFATLLARRERNATLESLSRRRVALWGFLGAVAVPVVVLAAMGALTILPLQVVVGIMAGYGGIGAALGSGTLALARRAPDHTRIESTH